MDLFKKKIETEYRKRGLRYMIKFKTLIHKKTGTVIKYDDWLEKFKNNNLIIWKDAKANGRWQYNSKNVLFSDDFEIIYDSEFTAEEIEKILHGIGMVVDESRYDKESAPVYKSILTKIKNQYKNGEDITENIEWLMPYFE